MSDPPEDQRLAVLNDVWKVVMKLKNPAVSVCRFVFCNLIYCYCEIKSTIFFTEAKVLQDKNEQIHVVNNYCQSINVHISVQNMNMGLGRTGFC